MPGTFERLDRLENTMSAPEAGATEPLRRLERAERRARLVEVDLRVALVGGDHEAVRSDSSNSRSHSASVITCPVGFAGEHT